MRLLVVGAGIGGLAGAIALRKAGHQVVIAEQAAGPASEGFSITIPANGTRALNALGVLEALRPVSTVVDRLEYVWQDEVFVSEPLEHRFGSWDWLALARRDLLTALRAQAGDVQYGMGVTAVEDGPHEVVVMFRDGRDDRFDLVVGADGVDSTIRSLMPNGPLPEWAGILYYRAMLPDADREPAMRIHFGENQLFSVFPGGPGQIYGWGALPCPEPKTDPVLGRRQRLTESFSALGVEPRDFLSRITADDGISCTPPKWVKTQQWHSGRLVLIGDAAHACPPFMAQGACLAMEDALVLTSCLQQGTEVRGALGDYERRRQPRIALVHEAVEMSCQALTGSTATFAVVDYLRQAGRPAPVSQVTALLEPL